MDAGLTIKTREGDVVTLSTSRFSSINAHEYSSQGRMATENGQVGASHSKGQIQLTSGQAFSFTVQGDLNAQELADIEGIVSGIDGIVYEMAEGDMDEAVALALSMGTYDAVSGYEADITMTQGYSYYTEIGTAESAPFLADSQGRTSFVPSISASFKEDVSRLLEQQEADALAYAQQPLSQLFDHYLDHQAGQEATSAPKDPFSSVEQALKRPTVTALENAAKTVDLLIQKLVKDAFDKTLDELA